MFRLAKHLEKSETCKFCNAIFDQFLIITGSYYNISNKWLYTFPLNLKHHIYWKNAEKLRNSKFVQIDLCSAYVRIKVYSMLIRVRQFAYVAYVRTLELQVRTCDCFLTFVVTYAFSFSTVTLPSLTWAKHSKATLASS